MESLISPQDLRDHGVEAALTDAALQQIIAAEEAEIVRRYGGHEGATQHFVGRGDQILLGRPARSITSVTVVDRSGAQLVLDAADYALTNGGWTVERLATGPHPSDVFEPRVTVEFAPEDDTAQRTLVLVQLCKLAIAYTGYTTIRTGEGQITAADYHRERERLLGSLKRGLAFA